MESKKIVAEFRRKLKAENKRIREELLRLEKFGDEFSEDLATLREAERLNSLILRELADHWCEYCQLTEGDDLCCLCG